MHIIKTTALIPTKFCTTQKTKVLIVGGQNTAQQIQDGGWPPFWGKNIKSPYLCNCLTDLMKFGMVTQIGSSQLTGC